MFQGLEFLKGRDKFLYLGADFLSGDVRITHAISYLIQVFLKMTDYLWMIEIKYHTRKGCADKHGLFFFIDNYAYVILWVIRDRNEIIIRIIVNNVQNIL